MRVPRRVLADATSGSISTLDSNAVAKLARLARHLETSLENVMAWCAFLTVHLAFRKDFVRCLSAYNNRDVLALRTLPFMMANGLWQQSRLDPAATFAASAAAFAGERTATFRHARLPPVVFFATSLLLFLRGRVDHLPGTALLARLWARGRADRSWRLGAYTVDLIVMSTIYRAWRAWTRVSRSETVRTTGCFVNITTSLSESPPAGLWPVDVLPGPIDVPETVPGNPMIDIHRDAQGVRILFQGRYAPGRTESFVELFQGVVLAAAENPDGTLGALRDQLRSKARAFLD